MNTNDIAEWNKREGEELKRIEALRLDSPEENEDGPEYPYTYGEYETDAERNA